MKIVNIKRETIEDVVATLEHALELAKIGEVVGIVAALQLKDGRTRKMIHGTYLEDIPRAIGELETVKMWLFTELELLEVPEKEEELREIREEITKEKHVDIEQPRNKEKGL